MTKRQKTIADDINAVLLGQFDTMMSIVPLVLRNLKDAAHMYPLKYEFQVSQFLAEKYSYDLEFRPDMRLKYPTVTRDGQTLIVRGQNEIDLLFVVVSHIASMYAYRTCRLSNMQMQLMSDYTAFHICTKHLPKCVDIFGTLLTTNPETQKALEIYQSTYNTKIV